MPLCLCVCLSVCLSAASRVAKAFKDVLNEKQSTESQWNVSVPDTSPGDSFHHYFNYFLLSVSWFPFSKLHMILALSMRNQSDRTYEEVCRVSIPVSSRDQHQCFKRDVFRSQFNFYEISWRLGTVQKPEAYVT